MFNHPQLTIDGLIAAIFEDTESRLARPFQEWVKTSRRFRTFAEQYRDKIRKKQRLVLGDDGFRSLLLELEVAYHILQDERCTLEYEKYGASKQRSPDFTVTFRANTFINVEVTRIYATEGSLATKLVSAVCEKVGQMQPNMMNVLVVAADAVTTESELSAAMKGLRLNAEQKNQPFFASRGFDDPTEFLRQFQLVSAIVGLNDGEAGGAAKAVWLNSLAKRPLSGEIARWAAGL